MNPWVILGLVLLWATSLFGVGKWQREDGRTAERVESQAREIETVTAANAKIKQLNDAARAAEHASAVAIATIGAEHASAIETLEARRRRDVAAVRDGAIKLRVAGTCTPSPGGSAVPEARAAPGLGDGAQSIELPREATDFLLGLANDADQVADQLRSCQSIVLNDRKESP